MFVLRSNPGPLWKSNYLAAGISYCISERIIRNAKATEKAYRDYLNLYIRYKLKVQAALDLKLDTLAGTDYGVAKFQEPDCRSVYQ